MRRFFFTITLLTFAGATCFAQQTERDKRTPESTEVWEPQPKIVTPGATPSDPPSDAMVRFDGKNMDQWTYETGGGAAKGSWKNGAITVEPSTGDIRTKAEFGDMQLHIEGRSPEVRDASKVSQGRGNSGIFLQERYEVQVLDN